MGETVEQYSIGLDGLGRFPVPAGPPEAAWPREADKDSALVNLAENSGIKNRAPQALPGHRSFMLWIQTELTPKQAVLLRSRH